MSYELIVHFEDMENLPDILAVINHNTIVADYRDGVGIDYKWTLEEV